MSYNIDPFPMLPDSSSPNRMPAPSPCKSCVVSKTGWITAIVASLLAAFFLFQFLRANSEAKLNRNNAELTSIELQSMKQQLYAERILAERQISDLSSTSKAEPVVYVRLVSADGAAPQPQGVLVWIPARQSGFLFLDQLPATAPDEELRLWIDESGDNARVAAGILVADGSPHSTKQEFTAEKPVKNAVRFSLTKEHKGATAPSGPTLLTGTP